LFLGIGNKWKNWKPSDKYLLAIMDIDNIEKLEKLISKFVYKWDTLKILFWIIKWDNWQMPDESLSKMYGDCEDAAILAIDILGRMQKREDARFVMSFGYRIEDNKRKYDGHVITAFDNGNGKYDIFSNNLIEHNFTDFIEIGHKYYPLGLKYQEIRNWKGAVLSRKFKLFGTF